LVVVAVAVVDVVVVTVLDGVLLQSFVANLEEDDIADIAAANKTKKSHNLAIASAQGRCSTRQSVNSLKGNLNQYFQQIKSKETLDIDGNTVPVQ
jgi:hypothetical protein